MTPCHGFPSFMKNIVVLDGYTLNPLPPEQPSDIHPSWTELTKLAHVALYPRTAVGDIVRVAAEADLLLTNKVPISAETIAALPRLEYIGVMATGTNIVDLQAARVKGIPVTNVPGYSTMSVVQIVFSLLFEVAGKVGATSAEVLKGRWAECPDFSFTIAPFFELSGKTLGIVGYGAIGSSVAKVASALGMKVVVHSRTKKEVGSEVEWLPLDELIATSDAITLHCPLTPETNQMIKAASLKTMKPGAFLINAARGGLINEADVAAALESGHLGGFGADVLVDEPPKASNPLLTAPRTVITPHIAWASVEARHRLMDQIVKNIEAFLSGNPVNVVNK